MQHLCLLHFLLGILHSLGVCLAGLFAGLGLGLFQLDLGVLLGRDGPAQTFLQVGQFLPGALVFDFPGRLRIQQLAGNRGRDRAIPHVEGGDGAGVGLVQTIDALHGRRDVNAMQAGAPGGIAAFPVLGGQVDIGAFGGVAHVQVGRRILEGNVDELARHEACGLGGQGCHGEGVAFVVGGEDLSGFR